MAPKVVSSTNQLRALRPKNDTMIEMTMMNRMLTVVLAKWSGTMRSSAMVESMRVVAR